MYLDNIPIGALFAAMMVIMAAGYEGGFRLARARRRAEKENVAPVSTIAASALGLVAFMLAFAFGLATESHNERTKLVRNEANAIHTAYLRTELLPEPGRGKAQGLFRRYADIRLGVALKGDLSVIEGSLDETASIQRQLWSLAVANAPNGSSSDLFVQSVNAVIDIHGLRIAAAEARVPASIWVLFYIMAALGMGGLGYQAAVSGSERSWAALILPFSFSLAVVLILSLDRPQSRVIKVSQQPLADVRALMEAK